MSSLGPPLGGPQHLSTSPISLLHAAWVGFPCLLQHLLEPWLFAFKHQLFLRKPRKTWASPLQGFEALICHLSLPSFWTLVRVLLREGSHKTVKY
jgi:hypothetical protein